MPFLRKMILARELDLILARQLKQDLLIQANKPFRTISQSPVSLAGILRNRLIDHLKIVNRRALATRWIKFNSYRNKLPRPWPVNRQHQSISNNRWLPNKLWVSKARLTLNRILELRWIRQHPWRGLMAVLIEQILIRRMSQIKAQPIPLGTLDDQVLQLSQNNSNSSKAEWKSTSITKKCFRTKSNHTSVVKSKMMPKQV